MGYFNDVKIKRLDWESSHPLESLAHCPRSFSISGRIINGEAYSHPKSPLSIKARKICRIIHIWGLNNPTHLIGSL